MTSLSKTYYVSSKTGNDSNDGLQCERAFASLFAINHMKPAAGRLCIAGDDGSVFYGQYLQITDSGSKDAPIVIGVYGDRRTHRGLKHVDRESGIRIMEIRWMHRHMCITDMYRPQFYCMMQNILLWKIWKLQMRQARSSESSIHLETK